MSRKTSFIPESQYICLAPSFLLNVLLIQRSTFNPFFFLRDGLLTRNEWARSGFVASAHMYATTKFIWQDFTAFAGQKSCPPADLSFSGYDSLLRVSPLRSLFYLCVFKIAGLASFLRAISQSEKSVRFKPLFLKHLWKIRLLQGYTFYFKSKGAKSNRSFVQPAKKKVLLLISVLIRVMWSFQSCAVVPYVAQANLYNHPIFSCTEIFNIFESMRAACKVFPRAYFTGRKCTSYYSVDPFGELCSARLEIRPLRTKCFTCEANPVSPTFVVVDNQEWRIWRI